MFNQEIVIACSNDLKQRVLAYIAGGARAFLIYAMTNPEEAK
jgi:protein tyrosine phosphatase (PTP) superfamily phosphohydrolase (DUF442 family)